MTTRAVVLSLLALAVGAVFSFPNWWWYFTSPDYSVMRGSALSDDDLVPYVIALSDASEGWSGISAIFRTYETRDQGYFPSLSYWITNFLLGRLLRLAGSLELFVPVGLLLSGIVIFLLFYALARQFLDSSSGAVLVSLFACFHYPFYVGWVAAARHWIENGRQLDVASLMRLILPGMANASPLYPYLRWPSPGMMYWWFLLSLYLIVRFARAVRNSARSPSHKWLMVGAGVSVGLAAYVYFYFWTYLWGLLAVLAVIGWLVEQKGLTRAIIGSFLISLIVSAPLLVSAGATIVRPDSFQRVTDSMQVSFEKITVSNFVQALSTHGVLALLVVVVALPTGQRSAVRETAGVRQFPNRMLASLKSGLSPEGLLLFCMHVSVVLLASVELLGFHISAWHWASYGMDSVAPLTVGWMIARQFKRPCSGNTLLTAHGGRRLFVAGGVVLTVGAWYFYHRTVNQMSWVAFLPLGLWLSARKPSWTLAAASSFTGLNALLIIGLQGYVRPVMARPFFTQPREYTRALEWLDENAEPDSVVATNGWLSDYLIRAYTHSLTLSVPSWWTPVSPAEQQERYLIRSAIYLMTPKFLDQMNRQRENAQQAFKQKVSWEWVGGPELDILVEQQGGAALYDASQYAALAALPADELLSPYRVDYIWIGPWERYAGRRIFAHMAGVRLAYSNALVQIYQVSR